jgi:sulfate/thiosulfate transport system permease protein
MSVHVQDRDVDVMEARSRDARQGRRVRALMLVAALLYVGALLVAPLAGIAWSAVKGGLGTLWNTLKEPDVLHAFWLTAEITIVTVVVTSFFGVIVALVLSRDRFPGKRLVSALVDLPLAVSPVIVGLTAVLLFGLGGWFEPWFSAHNIQILGALPSMILVTIFVAIPFVIREVYPVLEELGMEEEQAAWTLGASRLQTFFRVTLPNIRWGLLYGIALSTARALGEVGAVLIVSGLIQGKTETATLIIYRFFEQNHYTEGYIVALVLALISIVLLVVIEHFKNRRIQEAPE